MKTLFRTQTPSRSDFWALAGFFALYAAALGTVVFIL